MVFTSTRNARRARPARSLCDSGLLLSALLLAALPARASCQDAHPLADLGSVSYAFSIDGKPVGREQVFFRENGWTAEGRFARGQRRLDYAATWSRTASESGSWSVAGTRGPVRCAWSGSAVEVFEGDTERPTRTVERVGEPAPLFYENLVWAVYSEMGARWFTGYAVGPGDTFALFDARKGVEHVVRVRTMRSRTWRSGPGADPVALREVGMDLGELGVEATFTAAGLLVHLTVPTQDIEVVCGGYEALAPAHGTLWSSGSWRSQLSKPVFEFERRNGVVSRMRDGVELVADVFVPTGEGPWPTILVRTPYGRVAAARRQGRFWARRGYAVVVQDVRGSFDSGGEWAPGRHEEHDGSDTLDWIAAQDWSDGQVGMIGGSYGGWAQLLAAVSGNPHLKAMVPQVAPPDPLEAFPYENGAFQLGVAWWCLIVDHLAKAQGGPPPSFEWADILATLPLSDLDAAMGIEQRVLDEWLAHPPSEAEYWEQISYQSRLAGIDVPALHITGWYDGDLPGALQNQPILQAEAATERARRGQFLVVGPWGHAFNQSRRIGDVDFGPDALVDLQAVYVRFFDRYLKGVANGIDGVDPVQAFVMGANAWRTGAAWPPAGTRFTKLFLGSEGVARARDDAGRLDLERRGGAGADSFVYDPADPPPSPEVTFGDQLKNSRLMDLSELEDRPDVLDYTTRPFEARAELLGPVELVVWIETDVADTDLCAKLLRIEPEGTTRRITGGIQRLRYRHGPGTDAPVEPGTPVEVRVRLRATGIALESGDRLRLEICSSEFPSFDRHPNTLEPAGSAADLRVATTRVLHDAAHPSHLLLPVAPAGGERGREVGAALVFADR